MKEKLSKHDTLSKEVQCFYKQVLSSSLIFYLLSWSLLAGSSYTKTLDGLEIHVDLMLYISYV